MRARFCKSCSRVVWSSEPCAHGVFNDSPNANFQPTVYYENEAGERHYADTPPPKEFGKAVRREITSLGEYSRFMKTLNAEDKATFERYEAKRQERMSSIVESGINRLKSMYDKADGEGRATIEAAIKYVRSKNQYSRNYDAGNHIKAFES
jgi:hypothetical protein